MPALPDYPVPPHVTQHWQVTKPAARGRRGLVVAQAHAAAQAGVAVLEAGGNAVDAAIATAFALAAVEPWNTGLGGIGFALVHPAGQARAEMVDFGPVAPAGLDPARFRLTGRAAPDGFGWPEVEGDANLHGPLSFVVPSAVEGYRALHARWGRMPMAELLGPAIALARRGLQQDWFTTLMVASAAPQLRHYAESARIYLPGGLPPVPPYRGAPPFFRLGRLADTLERLAAAGLRDFYDGDIAAALAADCAALGGVLSTTDLRTCAARIGPVGEVAWAGHIVQYANGLTAGPTLAGVIAGLPPCTGGAPDAAWYAALASGLKAAYADRLARSGDPDGRTPEGCTTHLTVCDADGGMVALTSTLLSSMGSKVVLPATGVLMNNGVMWFDPRPGSANAIAPGRRPLTNMCPVILRDGDRPVLAGGGCGGRRILAAVLQLVAFVAGFAMDADAAARHPRIDVSGPDGVLADRRLAPDILAALAELGPLQVAEHVVLPISFACPSLIALAPDGTRVGVSDTMSPWSAALAQPDPP